MINVFAFDETDLKFYSHQRTYVSIIDDKEYFSHDPKNIRY